MSGTSAVNSSPPPAINNALPEAISVWMGKLVAPMEAPMLSKEGVFELADRVKFLFGLALLALIAIVAIYQAASRIAPAKQQPQRPIEVDSTAIYEKFEALFADIKNLNTLDLENSLRAFHTRFDQHKDQAEFSSIFVGIEEVEKSLRFLKEPKANLFLAPLRMRDNGIISQPPDGNCLFHALVEGLKLLREDLVQREAWVEEPLEHEPLRVKIVTWMRVKLPTDNRLKGYLDRAIGDYIEVRKGQHTDQKKGLEALKQKGENISAASEALQKEVEVLAQLESLSPEAKYQWYLERVGHPGFFASIAEMYAFSCLYPKVSLQVYRELNGRYTDAFDEVLNPDCDLTIGLAYNLSGDHFNNYVPRA
jgi:hypothetical protein